jgi:hypothetical protein
MCCIRRYCLILRRGGGQLRTERAAKTWKPVKMSMRRLQNYRGRCGLDHATLAPAAFPESLAWEGLASTAHLSLRELHPGLLILRT